MLIHLAVTTPWGDWEIPWAGIGTFLLGAGSALSGYAAIVSARSTIKEKERHNDDNVGSDVHPSTPPVNTEDNTNA